MRRIRCAVYTRKSSEDGLEQDFNSLDAQREACEAYIASQKHEGWELLPGRYDDGGISGQFDLFSKIYRRQVLHIGTAGAVAQSDLAPKADGGSTFGGIIGISIGTVAVAISAGFVSSATKEEGTHQCQNEEWVVFFHADNFGNVAGIGKESFYQLLPPPPP